MCVAGVIFGQEGLTKQFFRCAFSMTAFFSLRYSARLQASTSLSMRTFSL